MDLSNGEESWLIKVKNEFRGSKLGENGVWVELKWLEIRPTHKKKNWHFKQSILVCPNFHGCTYHKIPGLQSLSSGLSPYKVRVDCEWPEFEKMVVTRLVYKWV